MKQLCTFLVLLASACAYGQVGPVSITSAECATIGVGAKVSVITFQVTGTWTGTLQPKITVQGQAAANVQVTPSTSSTAASTVTANGIYTAQVNGADTFQVCGNTVASGTANVYLNVSVASKGGSSGSGSSGTVTSVTFTGDGVVDSSTPSTAVTTSGTIAATIKTQTAHTFLGNNTGSTAAPLFAALALADLPGTVVNATSPGVGLCHFAGSTQTCTSSGVVAADITSGTITGTQLSSSIALPNGATATTQSAGDSSTKVATTAFVAGAATSGPAYAYMQCSNDDITGSTFTTKACSSTNNETVGDFLVAICGVGTANTGHTLTVTNTHSDTWTSQGSIFNSTNTFRISVFTATAGTSGADTFTCTDSVADAFWGFSVHKIKNVTGVDVTGVTATGSTTQHISGTVTTTHSPALGLYVEADQGAGSQKAVMFGGNVMWSSGVAVVFGIQPLPVNATYALTVLANTGQWSNVALTLY